MRKILLVAPKSKVIGLFTGEKFQNIPFLKDKICGFVPLSIATIAALTLDDIQVDLWDEMLHGWIDESTDLPDYDLVGITSYYVHMDRAKTIAQFFRKRGILVAIGGQDVSKAPWRYRGFFDILFIGEAELTWPQFIADWKTGNYRNEYRQVVKVDLSLSPPPRWDSIADQAKNYLFGAVQTSRGCPFDCEFCNVRYLFSRGIRCKPIDRVLEEIATLEGLGLGGDIAICDDNFFGNPHFAKELVRELISLNNSFAQPLRFFTEISIDVARDDEMLRLLADANFNLLSIGIESPNKESLKETNKFQNLRGDLAKDCKKIMSYGISVAANVIMGFDHDTPEIFDQQFEFFQETNIPESRVNLLKALSGTRLWRRLHKEGRVLNAFVGVTKGIYDANKLIIDDARAATNIIPQGMTRAELLSGFVNLIERLCDWDKFAARVKGFVSNIKRQPDVPQKTELGEGPPPDVSTFLFSLDEKPQKAIFDILLHTYQRAPFMMRKVGGMIGRHFMTTAALPLLCDAILKQIQFEELVDIEQFIDKSETIVPESFRDFCQEVSSEVRNRVYAGLTDKTHTYETLVRIFADFLAHWGKILDQSPDQHRSFLFKISDRVVAKENSAVKIPSFVPDPSNNVLLDIEKIGWGDEILEAIEQELRA